MINILKFFHILLVLSLLSSAGLCIIAKENLLFRLNKIILILAPLALLTGTLLVYPKNFDFHTPWIQAAFFLFCIFTLGMALMLPLQEKIKPRWLPRFIYLFLLLILIAMVHDAVTKTAFL